MQNTQCARQKREKIQTEDWKEGLVKPYQKKNVEENRST